MRLRTRVAVIVTIGALGGAGSARAADQPWRDPHQPPATRTAELMSTLSFDQEVGIALGDYSSVASLGVPTLSSDDGPSGIRADGTTALPSSQTLAASFDRALAHAYGDVAASEARGKGFNWWLGPAMDIARTPLAGRQPENLGEDPLLAGETVAQEVAAAKADAVIATLKHYVANNQEFGRIGFAQPPDGSTRSGGVDVHAAERVLQELYEAPFKRAVRESGADAVMCSYNRLNGPQTCESPGLLGDLKASGFSGFVVPDFIFAVRDPLAATLAGVDVPALGGPGGRTADMFTSGQVPRARLDDIVRRTLFAMFDSGVFDHPLGPAAGDVSTPAHRDVATKVSESGMVLLKDDRHALPLSDHAPRSLAVIGPSGTDAIYTTGGSASVPVDPARAVTPLAGITARAGGMRVTAAQGSLGDVPLPTIVPSSGLGGGLQASYWSNGEFSGAPALTRTEPTLDVSSAPAGVGPLWSARWTGRITPSETGLYRFSLLQAGLARVYVGGRLVASGYREATQFLDGPQYPLQAAVPLTAGHPVSIRVEYTSKAQLFGAQLHLAWQPPSASLISGAVAAARRSDAAVVLVDEAQGEGMDRSTLALPGDQDALIEAVAAVNPRTIVVLDTGGPVLMPWLDKVSAVARGLVPRPAVRHRARLRAVRRQRRRRPAAGHLPGERLPGPGAGHAPERYPGIEREERYDEGLLVGYRWYDATGQRPQFPFGYGLSYTRFRFDDLNVSSARDGVVASVRVTNVGGRAGTAVPQAYVSFPGRAGEPPWQLKGYAKVALAAGESRHVSFPITTADLSVFDRGRWSVPAGRFALAVGSSSRDFARVVSFDPRGRRRLGSPHEQQPRAPPRRIREGSREPRGDPRGGERPVRRAGVPRRVAGRDRRAGRAERGRRAPPLPVQGAPAARTARAPPRARRRADRAHDRRAHRPHRRAPGPVPGQPALSRPGSAVHDHGRRERGRRPPGAPLDGRPLRLPARPAGRPSRRGAARRPRARRPRSRRARAADPGHVRRPAAAVAARPGRCRHVGRVRELPRAAQLVGDVDDDARRTAQPEHAEARTPAQPEAERDHALEVAGELDLAEVRAQRRAHRRQQRLAG